MKGQSRFADITVLIYRQKMLKRAAESGVRQYIIFDSFCDRLCSFPAIENIRYFRLSEPITKSWHKKLEQAGYDKNAVSFVSLIGISCDMAKLAFSSLLLTLSDILKEGSCAVLDFSLVGQKDGVAYSFEELVTILNVAGFTVCEYISPKDRADMWKSENKEAKPYEKACHGIILAQKITV